MIADNLRAERARLGITQRELARQVGVNQRTISKIERGLAEPRVTQLTRLAKALGCPVMSLISDEKTRPTAAKTEDAENPEIQNPETDRDPAAFTQQQDRPQSLTSISKPEAPATSPA